jgi:hypothetical protein
VKRREYLTNIGKTRDNGTIKHTLATTLLLPTIGYCKKEFNNNLINVYVDEDLNNPTLVLIIDYVQNIEYSLDRLKINPIYNGHTYNDSEVIIKFKIPLEYHDVFDNFIKGKYSEFNNEYKRILANIEGKDVIKTGTLVSVYDIIYPRRDKIKQIAEELNVDISIIPKDVLDPPDLEYEIYKPLEQLINQSTKQLNSEG